LNRKIHLLFLVALGCATPGLEAVAFERLKFNPCQENASLDCGTLVVPVDYDKPHGEKVGIAVIRAKATNPAKRIGVIVGNPGGPGVSGVDFVLGGIHVPQFARIRERFDVVSFDPRGVARSRAVECNVVPPPFPDDVSNDEGLEEYFDELGRRYARACVEQNGAFVTHIGTNNVARDIDMIRQALGERQITYAAGSYGTELGAVYVSLFPQRVRAALLDGGVGPDYRDYLMEFLQDYANGFETSLQYLDRTCRRDANCRLAATGVVAAYDEVAARLRMAPVTSPDGTTVTERALSNVVAFLLQDELLGPLTVSTVADAQGGNYQLLFLLVRAIGNGGSALVPVFCNDYGTRRDAAEYLPVDEVNGARSPRFGGRFMIAEFVSLCAAWPRSDTPVIRNVKGKTNVPVLLVGNHFDPNTPLAGIRRMARALGMERSLIRYEGGGHTAFANGSSCIQDAIESYLFDLEVPHQGFTCPAQPIDFSEGLQLTAGARTAAVATGPFWRMSLPRPVASSR
jgi:pimeloyl-ACP methyl ester carboxylesterase